LFICFCCGAENGTQGLINVRQAPYYWATPPGRKKLPSSTKWQLQKAYSNIKMKCWKHFTIQIDPMQSNQYKPDQNPSRLCECICFVIWQNDSKIYIENLKQQTFLKKKVGGFVLQMWRFTLELSWWVNCGNGTGTDKTNRREQRTPKREVQMHANTWHAGEMELQIKANFSITGAKTPDSPSEKTWNLTPWPHTVYRNHF
jgi:hypothetical protein